MASGALPPAFPAVRIDGELYWDGGILSNTPTERIFDDHPRRNSLIFAVHLWHPTGDEPETIWQILNRHKDIQYSSRIASHIVRQRETHKLRHVITKLLEYVPEEEKNDPLYQELAGYHCDTRMHVVRLLSPKLDNETHTKDIDFSPAGIRQRWEAGYADTNARARAPGLDRRVRPARRRASCMSRSLAPSQRLRSSQASHPDAPTPTRTSSPRSEGAPMNACTGISAIQLLAALSPSCSSCSRSTCSGSGSPKSCMATTLPSRSGSGAGSTPSSQPAPSAPRSCCCSGCTVVPARPKPSCSEAFQPERSPGRD